MVEISTFRDHPFRTNVSSFPDCFRQVDMRPRGQLVGSIHCHSLPFFRSLSAPPVIQCYWVFACFENWHSPSVTVLHASRKFIFYQEEIITLFMQWRLFHTFLCWYLLTSWNARRLYRWGFPIFVAILSRHYCSAHYKILRHFRLPPRSRWEMRCSWISLRHIPEQRTSLLQNLVYHVQDSCKAT